MNHRLNLAILSVPGFIGICIGIGMLVGIIPGDIFFLSVEASSGVVPIVVGLTLSAVAIFAGEKQAQKTRVLSRAVAGERQAQIEARRRFVHRLDHELKNPLTAMRAGLANLAVDASDSVASLGNVGRQVDRLTRLVNDLRKLADLETHAMEREPVDSAGLVGEVVEMIRAEPARSSRVVHLNIQQIPWELGPVRSDHDLLFLAIYNLLDNALKFSPPEAAVEVRVIEDGTWTAIEVADSGPGTAAHDLVHVTEELYRGQGAYDVEGSGLGLALVERIASLHGGSLSLRSRPGKGTLATLRIPLDQR